MYATHRLYYARSASRTPGHFHYFPCYRDRTPYPGTDPGKPGRLACMHVGMFRVATVQLTLHVHVWLNFSRYILFFFVIDSRGVGLLIQIPNPRNRKATFAFRIAFSFQRLWLVNFIHAHVTSSDSEIRGIEMLCFFCSRCLFQPVWPISSCSPFHEFQTQIGAESRTVMMF